MTGEDHLFARTSLYLLPYQHYIHDTLPPIHRVELILQQFVARVRQIRLLPLDDQPLQQRYFPLELVPVNPHQRSKFYEPSRSPKSGPTVYDRQAHQRSREDAHEGGREEVGRDAQVRQHRKGGEEKLGQLEGLQVDVPVRIEGQPLQRRPVEPQSAEPGRLDGKAPGAGVGDLELLERPARAEDGVEGDVGGVGGGEPDARDAGTEGLPRDGAVRGRGEEEARPADFSEGRKLQQRGEQVLLHVRAAVVPGDSYRRELRERGREREGGGGDEEGVEGGQGGEGEADGQGAEVGGPREDEVQGLVVGEDETVGVFVGGRERVVLDPVDSGPGRNDGWSVGRVRDCFDQILQAGVGWSHEGAGEEVVDGGSVSVLVSVPQLCCDAIDVVRAHGAQGNEVLLSEVGEGHSAELGGEECGVVTRLGLVGGFRQFEVGEGSIKVLIRSNGFDVADLVIFNIAGRLVFRLQSHGVSWVLKAGYCNGITIKKTAKCRAGRYGSLDS